MQFDTCETEDEKLLVARGLGFTRGGRVIFSGVDFALSAGQRVALVGNNGSGKSTLLRALAGVLPQAGAHALSHGDVLFGARSLAELPPEVRARLFSWLPQALGRESSFSVRAFLRLRPEAWHSASGTHETFEPGGALWHEVLSQFDVADLETRLLPELSGGEWRRVQLAKAWLTPARVLLLDEPSAGLDLAHVASLRRALEHFTASRAGALVFACHDLALIARAATHVAALDAGRLAFFGSFARFREEDVASSLFGTPVSWHETPVSVWHPLASL